MELKIKKLNIDFDEAKHTYTRKSDGKLLTGVTTILGIRNKAYLMFWAAKMVVENLKERYDEIIKADKEEFLEILDEAKKTHTRKKEEAGDLGKQAHTWIENYIKTKCVDKPKDEKVANMAREFLKWQKAHKVKWLASEMLVASDKYDFAGTLDGLAMVDGKLTLMDFKSSNQISEDYALQVSAYALALSEMGVDVEQRIVLRLGKEKAEFEAWLVDTDLKFDQETFIHCREIHRYNVYIANHFKDERGKLITNRNNA